MNDKEALVKKLTEWFKNKTGISFVEVEEFFIDNGFNYKGDMMISRKFAFDHNIIFWCNWNEDAANILASSMKAMEMDYAVAEPLIYIIDGVMPQLPIARRVVKYKNIHWLPVVISKVGAE